jgi:hypothetical protein
MGSLSVALPSGGSWRRGCDGRGADMELGRSYRRFGNQRGVGCVLREAAVRGRMRLVDKEASAVDDVTLDDACEVECEVGEKVR